MNRRQWVRLLVFFIASVGIAIGYANLLVSHPNLPYRSEYQTSDRASANTSPIEFPVNYRQQFVQYATVDCPNSGIVRKMYINRESLGAIAVSETIPSDTVIVMETHAAHLGDGGRLVPTQLNNVFIRKKQTGWKVDPDSGEWQSAWYRPSGSLVSDDQSSCISCHTRVRDRDYIFTLPALITAAQTRQPQKQQTEFGTPVCR
jgi:Cytochrome P460